MRFDKHLVMPAFLRALDREVEDTVRTDAPEASNDLDTNVLVARSMAALSGAFHTFTSLDARQEDGTSKKSQSEAIKRKANLKRRREKRAQALVEERDGSSSRSSPKQRSKSSTGLPGLMMLLDQTIPKRNDLSTAFLKKRQTGRGRPSIKSTRKVGNLPGNLWGTSLLSLLRYSVKEINRRSANESLNALMAVAVIVRLCLMFKQQYR